MGKLAVLAGAAAGYVLGSRAGRERYEQIRSTARRLWQDPRVQQKRHQATATVKERGSAAAHKVQEKVQEKVEEHKQPSNGSGSASGTSAGTTSGPGAGSTPPPSWGS